MQVAEEEQLAIELPERLPALQEALVVAEMVVHQRLLQLTAFQEPQILAAAAGPVEAMGAQMVRLVPAARAS
jgi:hypothetical protein